MNLLSKFFIIYILIFFSCTQEKFKHGKRSYQKYCSACHMDDGTGIKSIVPDLFFDEPYLDSDPNISCLIRNGIYNPDSIFQMEANTEITDIDITNVINYILNDLNDLDTIITIDQTHEALSVCSELKEIN